MLVCLFEEIKPLSPGHVSHGGASSLGLAPLSSFLDSLALAIGRIE